MGAYLSKPVTEKFSKDDKNESLSYGASAMQGWRVDQEDAHNAILDYDEGCSLFAVYDGHGGVEVASYAASKLPDSIKEEESFKKGEYSQALTGGFLKFDASLVQPEVLDILKEIAGNNEAEESDDCGEDVDSLQKEAEMPLEELMVKYSDEPSQFKSPNIRPHKKSIQASEPAGSSVSNEEENDSPVDSKSPKALNNSENSNNESSTLDKSLGDEKDLVKSETKLVKSTEQNDSKLTNGDESKSLGTNKLESNGDCEDPSHTANMNGDVVKINGNHDAEGSEDESENKENVSTDEDNKEVKSEAVNGVASGKLKGHEKSLKGKSIISNAIVQALKVAHRQEKRRKAAEKAEQIYKKIQGGDSDEIQSEDDDSDDDDNYENSEEAQECDDEVSSDDEDLEEEEGDNEEEEDEDEGIEEEDDSIYQEFHTNMITGCGYDSGCTACVAFVKYNELYVANVGDSRCVVCRDGKALDMSIDHKPEDELESARITKAGGRITGDGRVNGGLNLSRALGDHSYKQNKSQSASDQMISPLPDVRSLTLTKEDSFMVIACDGIWNSMNSQEVCDFISERMNSEKTMSSIAEEMFDHCLSPDASGDGTGCDNMTCIIVKFSDLPEPAKRPCVDPVSIEQKKAKVDDEAVPENKDPKELVEAHS